MKKIYGILRIVVAIASFFTILYLIILFFLNFTSVDSIIGYLFIGVVGIVLSLLSVVIIISILSFILDFISLLLERQYHKAKIISSKMKHLKNKLDDLNDRYKTEIYNVRCLRQESNYRRESGKVCGIENEEYYTQQENFRRERENKAEGHLIKESNIIEQEIKYITDEKLNIYLREKLGYDFIHENKVGLLFGVFGIFFLILIITQPKNFLNYEDSKNWLAFFAILIMAISILIYKAIKQIKKLKYVSIWIFSIIVLTIILFYTKPYSINIESVEELFWCIGCCSLISALSISISKGLE